MEKYWIVNEKMLKFKIVFVYLCIVKEIERLIDW